MREKFEELVYRDYYIRTIVRSPQAGQSMCGALDFIPTAEHKNVVLERDGELYKRPEISAMWHGWKLRDELDK